MSGAGVEERPRWAPRPVPAAFLRAFVFLVPIAMSVGFVAAASRAVPMPTSSLLLYIAWWLGLSAGATLVMVGVDTIARKALPLVALLKLSLVFPDEAPSRFRTALRSGTVKHLEQSVADARAGRLGDTPVEAAEQLLVLVGALNAHDRLTRGHSERVRAYTKMIAEELKLDPDEIDLLHWAGLLHDIGKLEVPAEILNKTSELTDEEWESVRRHPETGMRLVEPLREWLGQWADAVGQHHERWDGLGYPNQLAETEISYAARIVAVADVFDVITSVRSYKKSYGAVNAREEITRCAGTQFDPRVVRAFLNISIGRLRFAMGPLSWLAHAPIAGRIPLSPAVGAVMSALGLGAGALFGGAVHNSAPPTLRAQAVGASVVAAHRAVDLTATIDEDTPAAVPLTGLKDLDQVSELRLSSVPAGATVRPTAGHEVWISPPPDFNGALPLRYHACWGTECHAATLKVTVRPANDPPVASPDVVEVLEDTPQWVAPLDNDRDVDGDTLALTVGPSSVGELTAFGPQAWFVPPTDFFGSASFSYRVSDPSGASDSARERIRVKPVNDAPSFLDGLPVAIGEHAGPQEFVGWASGISSGAANESDQTVSFSVTNDTPALFDVAPTVASDGTLTFTPAPDASGTATVTVRAVDDGGTANGGVDTSPPQSFTINVSPVNQAPSFRAGGAVTVREDSGRHVANGWASDISPGPVDESGQTVSFSVTNDNPALFDVAPTVAANGTLSFTPATNAAGAATVTVRAVDDGGTANGGVDTSPPQSFTITVLGSNDAPSFTAGGAVTVNEDSGSHVSAGWASAISPGPADESGQVVSFSVTNDNAALFAVAPAVAANGTLTFRPAPDASGSATVTVRAFDDGGTANGGVDSSPSRSFTITVVPVNDAPVAGPDAPSVNEDAAGVTFNVLTNDSDVDGGALSVVSFDPSGLAGGWLTDNGGGSFTYSPNADWNGTDSFSYTVSDGRGGLGTGTVTVTVVPQPDAPVARAATYSTPEGAPLTISAPGLLGNDFDEDGDPLTVNPIPVAAPTNGSLSLAADGSFVYTPNPGFQGTDNFTYLIDDGTGRTATAGAWITVDSGTTTPELYFGNSGSSATNYAMTTTPPPVAVPVPDSDGDGKPGVTIKASNGAESNPDPDEYHLWTYAPSAPLVLDGPVKLELWSSIANFEIGKPAHPYVYLYDCAVGGTGCVKIAQNDFHRENWNVGPTWTRRLLVVGSVTRTIAVGRELRVRVLNSHEKLWIAMTAAYPSGLIITQANVAPVAAADAFTVVEDSGASNLGVLANDVDTNLDPTTVTITGPPSRGIAVARPDGSIDYTPTADANGVDTFTYQVCDTDGLCGTATVAVTVTPLNDAPSFTAGGASSVPEDSGAYTLPGWASAVSPGPPDESAQSVSFSVTNDNPALFSTAPAVAADGTLSYTLAPDAFGIAAVTVRAVDTGGTIGGGMDTSAPQMVTITVTPVNDTPVFVVGSNLSVGNLAGPQSYVAWATGILAGPPNESGQTLTFTVVNDNPTIFSVPPAVAADGTLTFTPNPGASGTATVTVTLGDDGGTVGGGVDTSAAQTFTVTVT